MARKIDPAVETILKDLGLKSSDVLWDCHGTWVMYHRALERVATDQGIRFEPPQILEANGTAKSVAICVTGRRGDAAEWSIGEAAPGNNKNAYPWAMAEKRAKDRVILKLIGLHGLIYSEEEMDEKPARKDPPPPDPAPSRANDLLLQLDQLATKNALGNWSQINKDEIASLPEADKSRLRAAFSAKKVALDRPSDLMMSG